MRRVIWFLSIALALGLLLPVQAHADTVIYGVRDSASGDELVTINPTTGDVHSVGIIESVGNVYNPFYSVLSLAYDSNSDTLYAVDTTSDFLLTLDRETAQASGVGSGVGTFVGGLSFDDNGTLYGFDSTTSSLYTIDTNNGAATFVQSYDNSWTVGGVEFNTDTGQLFGVEVNYDQLVTFDLAGGSTVVGSTGSEYPRLSSLTYDPTSQRFLATEAETYSLVSIDPGTGATTFLADLQGSEIHGLTLVPAVVPVPPAVGSGVLGFGLSGWVLRRKAASAMTPGNGSDRPNMTWRFEFMPKLTRLVSIALALGLLMMPDEAQADGGSLVGNKNSIFAGKTDAPYMGSS